MYKLKWILVLLMGLTSSVHAKDIPIEYRAERMYDLCTGKVQGEDEGMQSVVCTFRLQGVVSMMIENCLSITENYKPIRLFTSEIPPSNGAIRQAYINFMKANPDKWGLSWHITVAMALSSTFPCKR